MKSVLQFLRILDSANQLSLTNISVIGALITALVSPSPYSILTFFAALVSYQWKRYHDSRAVKLLANADKARIDKLESDISSLRSALALKR